MSLKVAGLKQAKTRTVDVTLTIIDEETRQPVDGVLTVEFFSDTIENSTERFKDLPKDANLAEILSRRVNRVKGDADTEWTESSLEFFSTIGADNVVKILNAVVEQINPKKSQPAS